MAIEQEIPNVGAYAGIIPNKLLQDEVTFANYVYPFHLYYNNTWIPDVNAMSSALNIWTGQANTLKTEMNTLVVETQTARDIAVKASKYLGDWVVDYSTVENPNGYPIGCSVSFNDEIYYSKVADNQAQPTTGESDVNWFYSGRKDYVLTAVKTANYTSVHYDHVPVDTTGATFTVELKANPAEGDRVKISDNAGYCGTNKLIVGRNGQTIMGLAEDYEFTENYQWHEFVFINGTWRIF